MSGPGCRAGGPEDPPSPGPAASRSESAANPFLPGPSPPPPVPPPGALPPHCKPHTSSLLSDKARFITDKYMSRR